MASGSGIPARGTATPRSGERGLWARRAARAGAPGERASLYTGLARRVAGPASAERAQTGLWAGLARRVDPRHYRPQPVAGVATAHLSEDGAAYLALRSPAGGYLRLTPAEGELWAAMDGTQTVEQLALLGFTRFGQLLPVAGLVESLRRGGFLRDRPAELYRGLCERLERGSLQRRGRRIAAALRAHAFPISGIDAVVGALYRGGGWMLFSRPFLVVLAMLVIAGLGAFTLVARGGHYALINADNTGASLLGLWAALLVSFVLHELAHALAVKHFGRRVPRGGVMIYYGMPAAFVDTSDMWLAGRRPRMIVTLAGPLCDLAVGSAAALAAATLPAGPPGAAAYKLALAGFLAALCNLNPLLELDGYYMLSDWLRMPNLRRQALAFIRGPLWQKLRSRTPLDREERIYTLYGLLAAAYTALAIVLALGFWQAHLARVIGELWAGGVLSRLVAGVIMIGVVAPLALGLLLAAGWLVAGAAAWVARRGYGRSPALVAATLTLLAGALAALPLQFGLTPATALIAPLLWLVALAAQLALHAAYRRARVARVLDCFLAVTVIELLALAGLLLFPAYAFAWSLLQNLGFALLLFAGLIALLDVDLRQAPPLQLAGSALLLALAFLAGGMTIGLVQAAQPAAPFALLVLSAAPVYAGAVALALLLPLVSSLSDSRLLWSWLLLWFGIAAQGAAYVLELLPAQRTTPSALAAVVLASGLWTAAWCSHLVALRQLPRGPVWPLEPATGEAERLQRAFRFTYAGLYRVLRAHHGARRTHALDDRMDVLAATANWDVTLDRDEARIGAALAAAPLDLQGARYAEVLRYTVAVVEELAGLTFARHAIQAAYDALPWPEREAADRRCFPNTPWARALSRSFGDARTARLRLLRAVDQFAAWDDDELQALASALERQRLPAGTRILTTGQPAPGLWIIEAGEVVLKHDGQVVAELHRGACFGAGDARAPGPAHEYRASVDSTLLFLSRTELARLQRQAAPRVAASLVVADTLRTLERAPFFQQLPRATLRQLASVAEQLRVPPRSLVIRQGQPDGRLYVLVAGKAAVVKRADGAAPQVVARLGPGELFGERELLRGSAPLASVVAVSPLELIALPHAAVRAVLAAGGDRSHELERNGVALQ
ncbi:MAG: cyclic nucleotide-binding domain-containing protein [Chloroflexi bacterium]|nr:cyclic nucleotide-binding domain-containing protein [Chloroflexota bacterium]